MFKPVATPPNEFLEVTRRIIISIVLFSCLPLLSLSNGTSITVICHTLYACHINVLRKRDSKRITLWIFVLVATLSLTLAQYCTPYLDSTSNSLPGLSSLYLGKPPTSLEGGKCVPSTNPGASLNLGDSTVADCLLCIFLVILHKQEALSDPVHFATQTNLPMCFLQILKLVYFLSFQDIVCRIDAAILLPQASVNSALAFTLVLMRRTQHRNSSPSQMTEIIPRDDAVTDIADVEDAKQKLFWVALQCRPYLAGTTLQSLSNESKDAL
ncbi:hypothetical protein BT69DRAFT_1348259 [Atractiella rhizophila]|nr:hypothetical protein BT69DRAFT_1348259 [Atractiella rhizophila]